jgi:hypothetical protein
MLLLAVLVGAAPGCHSVTPAGAREIRIKDGGTRVVTQAELEADVQRFASQFMESMAEGAEPLLSKEDPEKRQLVLRQVLVYETSTLEIATGPTPEINLLDMIVFVSLSRAVLERYWVPEVWGEKGQRLLSSFATAEDDLTRVSLKVLSESQNQEVKELVQQWLRENPDRVRVESVRFLDFSVIAGKVSQERARETRGLFGSVKAATAAADQALLLVERAMFLANRLPFLIRLQTRLGASELTSDALSRLGEVERLVKGFPDVYPLTEKLVDLAQNSRSAANEARAALEAMEPLLARLPPQDELRATLDSANRLTERTQDVVGAAGRLAERTQTILEELRTLVPKGEVAPTLTALETRVDRLVRRWVFYLVLLGAAWSVFFWGGYYVFKRLTR